MNHEQNHDGHDATHMPPMPEGWHVSTWRNDNSPSYGFRFSGGEYAQIYVPYPIGHLLSEGDWDAGACVLILLDADSNTIEEDSENIYSSMDAAVARAFEVFGSELAEV